MFQFYTVCHLKKIINFGLGTVGSERAKNISALPSQPMNKQNTENDLLPLEADYALNFLKWWNAYLESL